MKKWSMLLMIAAAALLVSTFSSNVSAQEEPGQGASISVDKSTDPTSASLGDTITYIYTVTNTGQVTTDNLTLIDDKLGAISLDKTTLNPGETANSTGSYTHNVVDSDFPGPITNTATATGADPLGNTVTDNVTASVPLNPMTKADILRYREVPGKGIDAAPGLQKPFNPKSQAAEHAGKKDEPKIKKQFKTRSRAENHP